MEGGDMDKGGGGGDVSEEYKGEAEICLDMLSFYLFDKYIQKSAE